MIYLIILAYVIPLIVGFIDGYRTMCGRTIKSLLVATNWIWYIPVLNIVALFLVILSFFLNIKIK